MSVPSRSDLYEATIRRMVLQSLERQEEEFARHHESDTDEQLLEYLRECTARLHHSPNEKEILGWEMIRARFGTWQAALEKAGLSVPELSEEITGFVRIQEEIEQQKVLYRERKKQKKLRHQQRLETQRKKRKI